MRTERRGWKSGLMLTVEENETLTRVGRDTPMGRLMRRFWLPICASKQIADPGGAPLRTQLLGESFVVFREGSGSVGVLAEHCVHRRASLALGRVEDGGIRCLFHGWKFAPDGTILDTPNHANDRYRQKTCAPWFPTREAGGVVWTYIGPRELEPMFQRYGFFDGPEENRVVIRINADANYLQLFEGGTDSSHVAILHSSLANPPWLTEEFEAGGDDYDPGAIQVNDNTPMLDIEDTAYGYHYAAKRQGPPAADGAQTHSVRVTPVILPTGRIIPAPAFQFYVFEVPQHDERTSTYLICHGPHPVARADILGIMGLDDGGFFDDDSCEFGATWSDRLGQDRDAMKQTWSGYKGIEQEDLIMALSMGPISDRSQEKLVAADRAVVHLRRRLLESVRRNEAGETPIGLDIADYSTVAALPDTIVEAGETWQSHLPGNMGLDATTDVAETDPELAD